MKDDNRPDPFEEITELGLPWNYDETSEELSHLKTVDEKLAYLTTLKTKCRQAEQINKGAYAVLSIEKLQRRLDKEIQRWTDLRKYQTGKKPSNVERIRWPGNITDLVYLFMELKKKGFLTRQFKER